MESQNPLRPYTALELVDRTFRIYRNSFMTFLVPVALVTVPVTIINVIGSLLYQERAAELQPVLNDLQRQTSRTMSPQMQAEVMRASGEIISVAVIFLAVLAITTLLQVVLVNSILTQLASENHLGFRATAGEALRAIRDRLMPLTVAVILEFVLFMIMIVAISVMTVLFPLCGLLFVLLIYIWPAMFSLLTPVMILERANVGLGIRRAWSLGKARIWQIVGITVVIGIINFVITLGLSALVALFVQPTTSVSVGASNVADVIVQSIVGILISPVVPIAFTLLYYDARVRVEGLDIAMQNSGIPNPRPADLESPQPTDPLVTGKDFGNMVLLALVVIGVAGTLICVLSVALLPFLQRF